jgi:hypothetical protein
MLPAALNAMTAMNRAVASGSFWRSISSEARPHQAPLASAMALNRRAQSSGRASRRGSA